MKGSVKKRRPTWYWWADLPRGAVGKRNRRAWGASAGAGNVRRTWRCTLAEIGNGHDPFPEHTTLAEYAAEWLEHKRADGLRPTTALR